MRSRRLIRGRLTRPPVETWTEVEVGVPRPFTTEAATQMASLYWRSARRAVFGLVRPAGPPLGPVVLRAVWASGPALIRMGAATVAVDEDRMRVAFPILDGAVVGAQGGSLVLAAERTVDALRLGVLVEEYTPRLYGARRPLLRLAGVPYAAAQNAVHDRVTGRFLEAMARSRA